MIHKMTMTLQAAGLASRNATDFAAPAARVGHALRRAVGFAVTVSGFAVIAVHGLQRVVGG